MRLAWVMVAAPLLIAGSAHLASRIDGVETALAAVERAGRDAVAAVLAAGAPRSAEVDALDTAARAGLEAPPPGASGPFTPPDRVRAPIAVAPPAVLSDLAAEGARAFARHCAACHGWLGEGGPNGPPLTHMLYAPSRFDDAAIRRAVVAGAPVRLWAFGDMAARPDVPEPAIAPLIAYLRATQAANGVE